jgi:hypothetical protein
MMPLEGSHVTNPDHRNNTVISLQELVLGVGDAGHKGSSGDAHAGSNYRTHLQAAKSRNETRKHIFNEISTHAPMKIQSSELKNKL